MKLSRKRLQRLIENEVRHMIREHDGINPEISDFEEDESARKYVEEARAALEQALDALNAVDTRSSWDDTGHLPPPTGVR